MLKHSIKKKLQSSWKHRRPSRVLTIVLHLKNKQFQMNLRMFKKMYKLDQRKEYQLRSMLLPLIKLINDDSYFTKRNKSSLRYTSSPFWSSCWWSLANIVTSSSRMSWLHSCRHHLFAHCFKSFCYLFVVEKGIHCEKIFDFLLFGQYLFLMTKMQ